MDHACPFRVLAVSLEDHLKRIEAGTDDKDVRHAIANHRQFLESWQFFGDQCTDVYQCSERNQCLKGVLTITEWISSQYQKLFPEK